MCPLEPPVPWQIWQMPQVLGLSTRFLRPLSSVVVGNGHPHLLLSSDCAQAWKKYNFWLLKKPEIAFLMHSKILGGPGRKINPHLQKWCTCCGALPDPQIRGFTDMRHICIVSLYTFQTESRQKKAGLKQI